MFDNLSERLERSFKILKGEGKITEINVAETLKDVRKAGGHSMAAGVRIRGPIEEVRLTILKAMREEVERVLRQKIS